MEYNRTLNAVIIGYLLTLIHLAMSYQLWDDRHALAGFAGLLGIVSLAAAYFSEQFIVTLNLQPLTPPAHHRASRAAIITAIASPAALALGYLINFAIILFGA